MLDFTEQTGSGIFIVLWLILVARLFTLFHITQSISGIFKQFLAQIKAHKKAFPPNGPDHAQHVPEKTADHFPFSLWSPAQLQFHNDTACGFFAFVTEKSKTWHGIHGAASFLCLQ